MLALSGADVRALVPMAEAIRLMGEAFGELSAGRATAPQRIALHDDRRDSDTLFMPAAVPAVGGIGLKVVAVHPHNAERRLPTIHALVTLLDAETGQPLAILDGTFLTALRTGAVSGKATELLARPDSRTLLCIGAGAQAYTQIWAVCTARPGITRVLVHSRHRASAERLIARLRQEAPAIGAIAGVVSDLAIAVQDADIICTATNATAPLFADADVGPGTHINAVGAYTPQMREVPPETVSRALVVVDEVGAALAEAGDLIAPLEAGTIARAHLELELGHLVNGAKPGRVDERQVTLFKSVGNAVQDIVVARYAVERATALGIGQRIEL